MFIGVVLCRPLLFFTIRKERKRVVFMNISNVLYNYISGQYGSVTVFSKESGIPLIDLNAFFLKDHVSEDICIGMKLCEKLNIDVRELVFNTRIKEAVDPKISVKAAIAKKNKDAATKNEIYSLCMRLSELEKQMVLDYIEDLS